MNKKLKVTKAKTNKINKFTGGKIEDYVNKELTSYWISYTEKQLE